MTDRLLSYRDVVKETTISESSIRRLIIEGKFPAPERLMPGRVVFRSSLVTEAVEKLLAAQRGA